MKILEKNSYCRIVKNFSLSESDQEVLAFLYLPLIKNDAYSLYGWLCQYVKLNHLLGGFTHEDLLSFSGLTDASFLEARSQLEAIGLLETFRKEETDSTHQLKVTYLYSLLPPASPKKFFDDILLRTLLSQQVGAKRYFFLFNYFKVNEIPLSDGFVEITTKFKDVFVPEIKEGDISLQPIRENLTDKNYKSQTKFDRAALKAALKEQQYSFDLIKKDIKEIENVCSLYDVELSSVVSLILQDTDSDGVFYLNSFIEDVRKLRTFTASERKTNPTQVNENSDFGRLVSQFNSLSPEEYLFIIFNAKPNQFMLKEIENLKSTFNFSNGIINALLDYSIRKTNGEFNVSFIEKVAYTLSSSDVADAYDAMVKLNSRDFEASQAARKRKPKKNSEPEKKEEESSLEEFNSLAQELGL